MISDDTLTLLDNDELARLERALNPEQVPEVQVRQLAARLIAEVRRHRLPSQAGGDLEARAREWLKTYTGTQFIDGWMSDRVRAKALAREFRAVQLAAYEEAKHEGRP